MSVIKIDGTQDKGADDTTLMSLEEFCSWARQNPVLPDDGETKDETRLSWNENFERHFREFVSKTAGGTVSSDKLAQLTDVGKFRRPVKAWLEDCFRAIYATQQGQALDQGLRRMSPDKQAAAAVAQSSAYGPVGAPTQGPDSGLILPPHLRRG